MNHAYFKSLVCIFTIAVIIPGCVKKPLDSEPVGQYTTGNFWRDQNDVLTGIAGIYNIMYQEDGVGHGNYVFEDQSDDISVDGDHADYWRIENLNAQPTDYQIRATWVFAYEQIARCNNALIYVPKVPSMDEGIRSRSLGEAYFMRAHAYYVLNSIYGEVPIILEENVLSGEYNVPKKTVEEVRTQIETDLQKLLTFFLKHTPATIGEGFTKVRLVHCLPNFIWIGKNSIKHLQRDNRLLPTRTMLLPQSMPTTSLLINRLTILKYFSPSGAKMDLVLQWQIFISATVHGAAGDFIIRLRILLMNLRTKTRSV